MKCQFNQLTQLIVSDNTSLTELFCGGNKLTRLDVTGATALILLDCGPDPFGESNPFDCVFGLTEKCTLKGKDRCN